MNKKNNPKIPLTNLEKQHLRAQKLRIRDLQDLAVDEIEAALKVPTERAKEIRALIAFQTIPSIGIRFAEDLVFIGYHSLDDLKGKDPAELVHEYELKKGYWIDPCVEDQFRLAVYVADQRDYTKNWWDFTETRKKFRLENGYPKDRPQTPWFEVVGKAAAAAKP